MAGKTIVVNSVEVTKPPITTVASGRCISAPSLVDIAIGKNPRLATSAVIKMGRSRASAVTSLTCFTSIPDRRKFSAALTQTNPFKTATPNSAMNPPQPKC